MSDAPVLDAFREHVATIQAYRTQDFSEAMTRKYLIDPLLAILGFQSPDELHLEVRVPNTGEFVDYELAVDGKPRAIVEAKSIRNEVTEQHAAQCVKYAALLGVQWCLVTNGVRWAIYDAYAPVSLSEKLVVDVPLENDDEAISEAWRVLSDFRLDALRDAEPLSEIIVERIVAQEFRRPDSAVISALRSAVKSRVGHRVSAESVVAALARMMDSTQLPREKRRGQRDAPPLTPGRKAALTRRLNREKEGEQITDRGGLRDLVDAGLLPPDAMLEMTWKGNRYTGHLRSGQIEVDGRLFSSPSAAGAYVRKGSATNGWKWWRYRDELLWSLRERLRTRR